MNIEAIVAMLALGITVISNCIWATDKYADNQKKKYAAEQDFRKLSEGQRQIGQDIRDCFQDVESRLTTIDRDIQEIKILSSKK
jgi:peptidoglycan hydrolase CwlO-like protein